LENILLAFYRPNERTKQRSFFGLFMDRLQGKSQDQR